MLCAVLYCIAYIDRSLIFSTYLMHEFQHHMPYKSGQNTKIHILILKHMAHKSCRNRETHMQDPCSTVLPK
jgi:hypothetical protein